MTASGLPTLVLNALYLHSKRDPVREAERLVESAAGDQGSDTPENPALVLGFGLGYAAGALAAKFPEKPIIVVERRANILRRALEERDLAVFLSRKGLVFVLDVDGVSGALSLFESYPGVPPLVIQNRALADMDEDWYTAVEDRIRTWHTRTNVNRATQRRFGKRWVRNLSRNLEVVRDIPGISRLERLLSKKNIPVFLAAAGPTLDATGTILDEIFKRCLIVATDTSLRFFLRHGIDPDFVVSVDPQYWNSRHLVPAPKTRMIAESAVYPSILRNQFSGIFLCASLFPLGRFIEDRLEPRGNLGAGGSVATSAWDFARHLGAGTIWIAGLDLSFPEFKTHFKGALFEEKSHAESGRFLPMETWSFRALRDGQPFTAKSLGGSTVLTDKRLSLYAAWFENRFSQHVDVKNFSLSNEGLALKGLKAAPKEELLALPECRKELDSLLNEVFQTINMEFNSEEARAGRVKSHKNVEETLLKGLGEIKGFA
ncbi:MAG: DUF115 domain-containing protein, partial [Treponema sp.]|nr:DUF115 domain-containing protein [Treponema sp.]